ncbi:MAG TPA: lysophospholipid acyltransferase family protein [Candidatus Acidoferrales bacterium]|nr:lysophospholipid acyltransferase family protein [Candidatus Acidoferrales bacterium]
MIRSAFVAIAMSLCTLVLGPPLILLTLITKSATLMYWTGVKMVVYVTRIAGEKVTVEGVENIPPGVCLFAANHTSNADAPAIVGAIPRRIAILGRKSLFDIPVVGMAFRLAKFVPVDRGNRDAALESVKIAVQYIHEGFSFLVYPEGTRSPDGRLQRFKKGSFAIAIEAGIPIVPVACAGAHRIMKKHSLIVRPGKVTVQFGKPIDASKFTIEQRHELAQTVYEAIAADLPEDQKPMQ